MECRFVYVPGEMHAAVATFRRLTLVKTLLWTSVLWLVLGGLAAFTINDEMRSTPEHPAHSFVDSTVTMWPLLIVPTLYTIYFFTPLWGYVTGYFFRRSPLCNQQVVYNVLDDGVALESSVLSQRLSWEAVQRAGEGKEGFILFWGKSRRRFNWLPKHGFSSDSEIDACRELIRKHVRQFKQA